MANEASRVIEAVRISELYHFLTGVSPKRIRGSMFRGPASWRAGDNPSAVSLDDERAIWHDFVTDQGGGVFDLVITCKGGTRKDALQLVADFAGVPLETHQTEQSEQERERWLEHKRTLRAELHLAQYWKRGAIKISEELLDELKAPLLDSRLAFQCPVGEIYETGRFLQRMRALDGLELIEEYHVFLELQPGYTAALVKWAQGREQQERRALLSFLGLR